MGASACGGGTEPGPAIAGTYQLTSVNGGALPYEYVRRVVEGRVVSHYVLDARLEFRTRNRVFDIRRLDFVDTSPDTLVAGYRVEGDQVLLSYGATPGNAAYTDTGTLDGGLMIVVRRNLPAAANVNAQFIYAPLAP